MRITLRFLVFLLAAASGFPQLLAPRIGYLRAADGTIRPLLGVRGNFLLSDPLLGETRSAAFSSSSGLIKTEEEILVLDAREQVVVRFQAPAGEALFAFDRQGAPAAVYFSETAELYRFEGSELEKVTCAPNHPEEPVRAIAAPEAGTVSLGVQRGDAMWLLTMTTAGCDVISDAPLPGVSGSLALLAGGSIAYTDGVDAVVRRPDMSETRIPLAAPQTRLEPIGPDWVHVLSEDGRSWALHVEAGRAETYRLPGGAR